MMYREDDYDRADRESAAVGHKIADGVQIPLRDGIIRGGQSQIEVNGQ